MQLVRGDERTGVKIAAAKSVVVSLTSASIIIMWSWADVCMRIIVTVLVRCPVLAAYLSQYVPAYVCMRVLRQRNWRGPISAPDRIDRCCLRKLVNIATRCYVAFSHYSSRKALISRAKATLDAILDLARNVRAVRGARGHDLPSRTGAAVGGHHPGQHRHWRATQGGRCV